MPLPTQGPATVVDDRYTTITVPSTTVASGRLLDIGKWIKLPTGIYAVGVVDAIPERVRFFMQPNYARVLRGDVAVDTFNGAVITAEAFLFALRDSADYTIPSFQFYTIGIDLPTELEWQDNNLVTDFLGGSYYHR